MKINKKKTKRYIRNSKKHENTQQLTKIKCKLFKKKTERIKNEKTSNICKNPKKLKNN